MKRGRWRGLFDNLMHRADLHSSYKNVFESPDGERVLLHICKVGHVFDACHVSGDQHTSAVNEGKRILALSILRFVRKDHSELIKQIEEGMNRNANIQE